MLEEPGSTFRAWVLNRREITASVCCRCAPTHPLVYIYIYIQREKELPYSRRRRRRPGLWEFAYAAEIAFRPTRRKGIDFRGSAGCAACIYKASRCKIVFLPFSFFFFSGESLYSYKSLFHSIYIFSSDAKSFKRQSSSFLRHQMKSRKVERERGSAANFWRARELEDADERKFRTSAWTTFDRRVSRERGSDYTVDGTC